MWTESKLRRSREQSKFICCAEAHQYKFDTRNFDKERQSPRLYKTRCPGATAPGHQSKIRASYTIKRHTLLVLSEDTLDLLGFQTAVDFLVHQHHGCQTAGAHAAQALQGELPVGGDSANE